MAKMKPFGRSLRTVVIALPLTILLGGAYAAWRYFDAPPLERYAPLLAQMAAHKADTDDQGRVQLLKTFPGLTPQDMAYIRWHDDGSFLALFPTFYGEGSQMAGLLYTSRPLQDQDTHLRDSSAINFAQRLIGVGTYDHLILEKQINPNWYHVSYKLH